MPSAGLRSARNRETVGGMAHRYEVDWPAAEAVGTWAGAFITAAAVFLAAQFSEWRDRQRRLAQKKEAFATLGRLFNQGASLISDLSQAANFSEKGIGPSPPPTGAFIDLIGVLGAVDVFQLHSMIATERLFQVKRHLIEALEKREFYDRDFASFVGTIAECELWERQVGHAAHEAMLAEVRGIWPYRNKADEWIYREI
jgi:hypothetical protein